MLEPIFEGSFKKDRKLAEKRRYDMGAIDKVIAAIINENQLPDRCRPHRLSGNFAGYMECHALNDVLLIYKPEEGKVSFSRLGTHSDLF
jgi:mRNA interferase YafQ